MSAARRSCCVNRRGFQVHVCELPILRHGWSCPELRRLARRPQGLGRASLPSLRPRRAAAGIAVPTAARSTLARHGAGTERVAELIAEAASPLPVFRLDSDSAAPARAHLDILRRFQALGRRRAGGHADGGQGPRLPGRRAERRPGRRRHAAVPRLPVGGADLCARRPAGRAQRTAGRAAAGSWSRRWLPRRPRSAMRRCTTRRDSSPPSSSAAALWHIRPSPTSSGSSSVRAESAGAQAAAETAHGRLAEVLPADVQMLGPAPRFRLRGKHRRQLLLKAPEREGVVIRGPERRRRAGRRPEPARNLAERRRRPAIAARPRASRLENDERASGNRHHPRRRAGRAGGTERRASTGARRGGSAAPRGGAAAHPQVRRPGPQVAGLRDPLSSAPSSNARRSAWWRSCTTPSAWGWRPRSSA